MEDLVKLIPSGVYQILGLLVLVFVIMFKDQIAAALWRTWTKNDADKGRRRDTGWFEKFLTATEAYTQATINSGNKFAEAVQDSTEKTGRAIEHLSVIIANLAEGINDHDQRMDARSKEVLQRLEKIEAHSKRRD